MELPKLKKTNQIGEIGLTVVKSIVENDLNWMFRENHLENDFGIDAYIDIISELGQVTGKSIALQIKTGESYFEEKNNTGWIYRGELKHLNYYLNQDIPVVILIVNVSIKKAFWCLCDGSKTENAGQNWKITIPFYQELNRNSKVVLEKYISPVIDYASQLEEFWNVNKMLQNHNRIVFIVDRPSIENGTCDKLLEGLKRLEANPELLLSFKGKVDIWIHGYDDDHRELKDIPEVKNWINFVFKQIEGWAYFLATDKPAQFLRLMQLCLMEPKVKKGVYQSTKVKGNQLVFDPKKAKNFFDELFLNLNRFCEKQKISEEVNKEVSIKVSEYLTGMKYPDYL
jgi:hypothetical protein